MLANNRHLVVWIYHLSLTLAKVFFLGGLALLGFGWLREGECLFVCFTTWFCNDDKIMLLELE